MSSDVGHVPEQRTSLGASLWLALWREVGGE